jgi:hypothetical protein
MRHMLLAATALAMLNGAAYAQNSTSGSNSTATNSSASQSQSISSPRVNVYGNPIGNGASSSNSSAGATANTRSSSQSSAVGNRSTVVVNTYAGVDSSGNSSSGARARVGGGSAGGSGSGANGANGTNAVDPAGLNGLNGTNGTGADPAYNVHYSGGYSVQNVPEVIPPSINGGNPCAVGASGGLSVSGFGIAGGATWADKQCERRQQAALLYNIGRTNAAVELMCQDDNVRAALRVSGEPCTADRVAATPAPAGAVAPLPAVGATPMPAKPKPEWCARARPTTEASKAYVAQQCDA